MGIDVREVVTLLEMMLLDFEGMNDSRRRSCPG